MPKRRLAASYLAVWLSEVIFPIAGKEIQGEYIYPACKMAFGTRFALAPTLVSYLCTRLKMIGFLVRNSKPYNGYFGEDLLYAWFVYHCHGLHCLREQDGLQFYMAVTNGLDMGLSLVRALVGVRLWLFRTEEFGVYRVQMGSLLFFFC